MFLHSVKIPNSSSFAVTTEKLFPNSYYKINLEKSLNVNCLVKKVKQFDETFSTFYMRFIKTISIDKITNACINVWQTL